MLAMVVDIASSVVTPRATRAGTWHTGCEGIVFAESELGGYYRFIVEPEWEPGDDHDHEAGDVDGDDVEWELPGEYEVNSEAGILPGGRGYVAVLVGVVRHLEASGQRKVGSKLQRARVFPNIDEVVFSPAIWNKRT